jgi:hypothetical protein
MFAEVLVGIKNELQEVARRETNSVLRQKDFESMSNLQFKDSRRLRHDMKIKFYPPRSSLLARFVFVDCAWIMRDGFEWSLVITNLLF